MTDRSHSSPLRTVEGGCELQIVVLPRSSRNCIVGLQDATLKIKISKPPVDGQANASCCRLIADLFGLPLSRVTIVRGHTSRRKTVKLEGINPEAALEVLQEWV
jgi:uncharacterized protein